MGSFAGARPGERVLDACASPGGKTLMMAAAMEGRGSIVATDVRGRRVSLLRETVVRSGATIVDIVQADAARPLPFGQAFDRVLLDAPCSGLGTVRRDPDIKWRRREVDLPVLAAAQLKMLEQAAAVLKDGGSIVYSTCSGATPARSRAALMATPPSWAPEKPFSEPSSRPIGVRAPATITFPDTASSSSIDGENVASRYPPSPATRRTQGMG